MSRLRRYRDQRIRRVNKDEVRVRSEQQNQETIYVCDTNLARSLAPFTALPEPLGSVCFMESRFYFFIRGFQAFPIIEIQRIELSVISIYKLN
jgi:hypothetical protein